MYKYILHIKHILNLKRRYKWKLLFDYCKLLCISWFRNLISKEKPTRAYFLNQHLSFPSFDSFLYLVEEIFIYETYRTEKEYVNIIDIGAHIGLASLYFSLNHPKAKVHAYELAPSNFSYLKKNKKKNHWDITIYNKAVVTSTEPVFLEENNIDTNHTTTTKSTNPPISTTQVETILKHTPDLIKIDTEGTELEIWKRLNTQSIDALFEVNTEELSDVFNSIAGTQQYELRKLPYSHQPERIVYIQS